jgi:hypothetical protein
MQFFITFLIVYILILIGDALSEVEGWDPINRFRHIFVPVPSQDLDFQHHMLWSFLCSMV